MKYLIFDLDNCISDDGWRIRRIDWGHEDPAKRYHRYHMLSAFDTSSNHELWLNKDSEIVIFTARPMFYSSLTIEWLERKSVQPSMVFMRPDGDHAPSKDLKRRHLLALFDVFDIGPEDVECAYDDREDVVQMYRDHGVTAKQVKIHDVCAYTNPIQRN